MGVIVNVPVLGVEPLGVDVDGVGPLGVCGVPVSRRFDLVLLGIPRPEMSTGLWMRLY